MGEAKAKAAAEDSAKLKPVKITVPLEQIIQFEESLGNLTRTRGLASRTAYRLARLIKQLKPEYESFNEARTALIKQYGVENENGDWQLKPENNKVFSEAVKELMKEPITFSFIKLDLDDVKEAKLSAADMFMLESILIEPSDEDWSEEVYDNSDEDGEEPDSDE